MYARLLVIHVRAYHLYSCFLSLRSGCMDDDIVSLLAVALIVDRLRRRDPTPTRVLVDQLSLSVYLMVKCQMQLHHSVTSLAQSLDYIQVARRHRHEILHQHPRASLHLLILKLAQLVLLKYYVIITVIKINIY